MQWPLLHVPARPLLLNLNITGDSHGLEGLGTAWDNSKLIHDAFESFGRLVGQWWELDYQTTQRPSVQMLGVETWLLVADEDMLSWFTWRWQRERAEDWQLPKLKQAATTKLTRDLGEGQQTVACAFIWAEAPPDALLFILSSFPFRMELILKQPLIVF